MTYRYGIRFRQSGWEELFMAATNKERCTEMDNLIRDVNTGTQNLRFKVKRVYKTRYFEANGGEYYVVLHLSKNAIRKIVANWAEDATFDMWRRK